MGVTEEAHNELVRKTADKILEKLREKQA